MREDLTHVASERDLREPVLKASPDVRDIIQALTEVRERWPYAVAASHRQNVIEFYLTANFRLSDPPVATYDLATGRLCMADMKNTYQSSYPRAE